MNNRRFGVEIECGYNGDGYGESQCSCECWCESEREYMRDQNDYYTRNYPDQEPPYEASEIDDFECDYCRYGCEGGCNDSYHDEDEGCEIAYHLLCNHGFEEWTDDIHPDGSGVEIPSPILQGREGLRELQQVMELLSSNGFYVSRSDGMHVHHDAPEWAADDGLVAHTVELWEENFDLIARFVDASRATNSMCRRWADPTYPWQMEEWEKFKATKDVESFKAEKFRALNIGHLDYRGSLEIRLHEGTLDFQKAAAWVRFGQGFLDFALKSYKRGQVITCGSRTELLRNVRVSSTTRRRLMAVERGVAVA